MRQQVLDSLEQKNIHYILTLESTQNYALELLSKTKPIEGTAILTYNQSSGRGQYGTLWQTEPGKNISVSFIFYPGFIPLKQQFILSKAIALAVAETVSYFVTVKVFIKWPNDIIANDKKLGGILINNSIQGDKWVHSVVGIGLNINQSSFPENLPHAASIYNITNQKINLEDVVFLLKEKLMKYYQFLIDGKYEEINRLYFNSLFGLNKELNYIRKSGERFHGTIEGIEESGSILLKTNSGIESFSIKEISLEL